ncbi:MAG: hypothetical protein JWR14_7126 [Caballeronia sp.]|nr:hypothetical protein [Caballeronia sp.]
MVALQEPASLGMRGGRSDTLCSKGRAFYLLHCIDGPKGVDLNPWIQIRPLQQLHDRALQISAERFTLRLFAVSVETRLRGPRPLQNRSLVHNRAEIHAHAPQQRDQLRALVRIEPCQRFSGN